MVIFDINHEITGKKPTNARNTYGNKSDEFYDYLRDGSIVKWICPKCKSDRLICYYIAGNYETRAGCPDCDIDDAIHTG